MLGTIGAFRTFKKVWVVPMLKARPFLFRYPKRSFRNAHHPTAPERHLKFHQRQWIIYLMGCAAMAVGTIIAVLTPGENPEVVLVPTGVFFLAHDRTEPRRTRALPDGIRPREEANLE
jgi:hypothetical protein